MTMFVTLVLRGDIFAGRELEFLAEMGDSSDTKQDIVVLTGKGLKVT